MTAAARQCRVSLGFRSNNTRSALKHTVGELKLAALENGDGMCLGGGEDVAVTAHAALRSNMKTIRSALARIASASQLVPFKKEKRAEASTMSKEVCEQTEERESEVYFEH